MHVAILVTHIRPEEKLLIQAFQAEGVEPDIILDRDFNFDLTQGADQLAPSGKTWQTYDVVLERCVSTSRGTYALAILNAWGIRTVNTYQTAHLCEDKLLTTLTLAQHNVPQPQARVAFTPETSLIALDNLNYPAVLKPVTGSWGRLLAKVTTPEMAESIIEHRQTLGDYTQHTYYVQEYVQKPQRDIRAFVVGDRTICAIYRTSPHWITNTARGGVLAIDVFEDSERGFLINEINHTMEFKNSSAPTGVNIAQEVVRYVLAQVAVMA